MKNLISDGELMNDRLKILNFLWIAIFCDMLESVLNPPEEAFEYRVACIQSGRTSRPTAIRLVLNSSIVPHAIGDRYRDGYGDAMVADSLSGRIDGDEGCVG